MKMKLYIEKQLDRQYLDLLEPYNDVVCNEVDELHALPTAMNWSPGSTESMSLFVELPVSTNKSSIN
jgi:hypothetical protein